MYDTLMLLKVKQLSLTLKLSPDSRPCPVPLGNGMTVRVPADRYAIRLTGRVTDVRNNSLVMECPALSRQAARLQGYRIDLNFPHRGKAWYFTASILGTTEDGRLLTSLPRRIDTPWKRDDVRLETSFPVNVNIRDNEHFGLTDTPVATQLDALDISAGGMRVTCKAVPGRVNGKTTDCGLTPVMDIEFVLPGTARLIGTRAQVTSVTRTGGKHEIGLRFNRLPMPEQHHIIQYIYQQQIRNRSREELLNNIVRRRTAMAS